MTESYTPKQLMQAAVIANQAAAEYLCSIDRTQIDRDYKTSSSDIVTVHDKKTEEIIVAKLRELIPGCTLVGEEGGTDETASSVRCYVDPIDGTSYFAAGLPVFCASIGIELNGELVAGAVNAPILGYEFSGYVSPEESHAYFNGEEIKPRAARAQQDSLLLTYYPGTLDWELDVEKTAHTIVTLKKELGMVATLAPAALQLCYAAVGWADVVFYNNISAWDVAGGMAIIKAVGGVVDSYPQGLITDGRHHLSPSSIAYPTQTRLPLVDELVSAAAQRRYGHLLEEK